MFDFEKLDVYTEIKQLNQDVLTFIFSLKSDAYIIDKWKRATISIMLNLSEGTGRMTNSDKRNFYIKARSSVFESVSLMDILHGQKQISDADYSRFYERYEKVSKMLLGMVRSFSPEVHKIKQ